jgi:hypothetical protein
MENIFTKRLYMKELYSEFPIEGFVRVQFKHEVEDSLNGVNLNTEIIDMRPFKLNINESHG